jgi:hypothetical protein
LIGLQGELVLVAMQEKYFSLEEQDCIRLYLLEEDNDKQQLPCHTMQKNDEAKSKILNNRYAIGREAEQLIKNGISHLSQAEQKEVEGKVIKYRTYLDKRRVDQAATRAKQLKATQLIQSDISHFSEKEQQEIVRDAARYKGNTMVEKARRERKKRIVALEKLKSIALRGKN